MSFYISGHAQQIVPLTDTTHVQVTIKEGTIYNNGDVAGSYRQSYIDTELTFIKVYSRGHARVAEVTHEKGAGTWTIVTPVDQEKMYAPYAQQAPLPMLFRYLIIKGYL